MSPRLQRLPQDLGLGWIARHLHERFEGLDEDHETRRLIAAAVAIEQVEELRRHGVREFHFYTLNQANLTYAACRILGIRPSHL